ncbi:MAG: glutamine amidotransferase [Endomicrobiia bacterium]|nr:glutamine amidotransferase [Endomicrobiia bacterium]
MTLTFENPAMIAVSALFALAAFFFAVVRTRAPRTLKILRGASIAVALLVAADPVVTLRQGASKKNLAILIDVSDSMFMSARNDDIKKYFGNNLKAIEAEYNLDFFSFAQNIRSIRPAQIALLKRSGATDITGALAQIKGAFGGGIDGILLFSDGVDTAARDISAPPGGALGSVAESAASMPVFVFNIFGNASSIKDVALTSVRAGDFSFKGDKTDVIVNVRCRGFGGLWAEVKIADSTRGGDAPSDNTPVAAAGLTLREGDNEVKLSFAPTKTGRREYKVSASTFSQEMTVANNARTFTVDVLRDKLRILYLCGRPSYEYAYLRDFIKNDFGIDIVTFVILRNPENVALVPDEELSLIPFPGADVLMNRLLDFDVVIFENFTFERFGIYSPHFDALKKWVGAGGGFLMMGGENSFAKGGYSRTPLNEIMPVILSPESETEETGLFSPVIADAASPVFYTESEPASFWRNSPKLDWIQVMNPHPDASVPMKHPWARSPSGAAAPVLALRGFSEGRTAALATNSTWRWKMGSSGRIYETFWRNLISWLASAREESGDNVIVPLENASVGDTVSFLVKKRSPTGRLGVSVTGPDGKHKPLTVGERGDYVIFSFAAEARGRYSVEITETAGKNPLYKLIKYVQVRSLLSDEAARLEIDGDFLRNLAEKSGGIYFTPVEGREVGFPAQEIAKRLKASPRMSRDREIRPFSSAAMFVSLTFLILCELLIRWRRYGLW